METQQKSQDLATVKLSDYLRFVRERWWVIALVTIVLVVATAYVSSRKTPLYQTSAEIIRQTGGWQTTLAGIDSLYYFYSQALPIDARMLASLDMAVRVKERMGSSRSADELLGVISVQTLPDTQSIIVSATGPDAADISAVVNGFAETFVAARKEDMDAALAAAKIKLQEQLAALPATTQSEATAVALQQRIQQLNTFTDLAGSDYKVLRQAHVPGAPFTPRPLRDTLLALVIGLVAGIALAFLLEYLDKRIKDEEAMERAFGLAVLASIPLQRARRLRRGRSSANPGSQPVGVGFRGGQLSLLEPYMMLRSNLQYFSLDKDLHLLMITSALPKHGKTTVTVNLGLTMALAGQRVILIECDLRRPLLHEYLGLSNQVGLTNVLAGTVEFSEALQRVNVSDFLPAKSAKGSRAQARSSPGNLFALCSGPLPPNPSQMLASNRMAAVLRQAVETGADYVLVDTAPALVVADPVTLAQHVDGVLITARLRKTSRDDAVRLRQLLDRAGAHALGVVVGSDRQTRRGYYGYGYSQKYGYGPDDEAVATD